MSGYHEGELEVQCRAGVLANAERIGRSIHREIPAIARRFAAEQRFVILGAADGDGRVWATVLRGEPGFLSASTDELLRIAAEPGSGDPIAAALATDTDVGLLIIDPPTRRRMRVNGGARPDGARGFVVATREVYANCQKYIHPRPVTFAAEAIDAHETTERAAALAPNQVAWLETADTVFLASRHPVAGADVSHRGGAPGFVRVPAPDRVLLPDYPGNMMFNSLGNLAADPRAGLLVVDFDGGGTLQISGRATIVWEGARVAAFAGAERLLEIEVDAVVETRAVASDNA